MATTYLTPSDSEAASPGAHGINRPLPFIVRWGFALLVLGGLAYAGWSIFDDTQQVGEQLAMGSFLFLGLALLIALGFEFVNGFHDTANAVATVIYTNSLSPPLAVLGSGICNFAGVIVSGGAVAYSIITLLPVDLILHVGSASGYAMIFALLFAAVLWNLATWFVGLPNSSSHALIGSILGVGVANQLLSHSLGGTSGLDWGQVEKVLSALLFSPAVGFVGALLLILAMRATIRVPKLYEAPQGDGAPPMGIRAVLVFASSAVSFSHGMNDGQKGMGLIMLILIGCAPTAYALNRTMPQSATPAFVASATAASAAFHAHGSGYAPTIAVARGTLVEALRTKQADSPAVFDAIDTMSRDVSGRIAGYGSFGKVPAAATPNLRNDMYLVLDTARLVTAKEGTAQRHFSAPELAAIGDYQGLLENGTRYIPLWVKVTVALALGLGTMVGWKRIVVTVGEKIGTQKFTYGMGASAQLVAAGTIMLAAYNGAPVSTTHILTSGVAGASVGNGGGLQAKTIANMVLAWVMTLPAAMLLSGGLYFILLQIVRVMGIA